PFTVEFHIKLMHLPYSLLEWPFPKDNVMKYLSLEERAYLEQYFRDPERYPERIFMYILLGAHSLRVNKLLERLPVKLDPKIVDQLYTQSTKNFPTCIGIINNKELLALWQKSPFYARDVKIIKKMYQLRLHVFDSFISGLLKGFGD